MGGHRPIANEQNQEVIEFDDHETIIFNEEKDTQDTHTEQRTTTFSRPKTRKEKLRGRLTSALG